MKLDVLFEDNHLLIINKPPGVLVQGDNTGDTPLVDLAKEYIKEKYAKPGAVFLGVVHRLDRPTSGAIVFARTSKALQRLNAQFKERTTYKIYWAIIEKTTLSKKQKLEHWMVRKPKQNKSFAYTKEVLSSKKAVLHYQIVKQLDNYSLIEIELETGRHHQIRAQLSAIGKPIKGDLKYGAKRSNPDGSIHLHARSLTVSHPVTKENMTFVAEPPKEVIWSACVNVD